MGNLLHRSRVPVAPRAAVRRHAMQVLRERSIPASRIVDVQPYGVTYLDQKGRVNTAWLTYLAEREKLLVITEPGLPAFPGSR